LRNEYEGYRSICYEKIMQTLPIRLTQGQDLRQSIEAAVRSQNCCAAFVLSGIGSLSTAGLRFARADQPQRLTGDTEILSLSGTVAVNGLDSGSYSSSHLHMALSTATGEVFGGHVAPDCIVHTTAEVLLALLPEWEFAREPDALTGYDELVVRALDVTNCDVKSGQASGKAIE